MRQFNKLRNTKGFVSLWQDQIRLRDMNIKVVERRAKILTFWKQYGEEAAKQAFGASRRTLFRWQRALSEGHGRLESLNPKSRAPQEKRKRVVAPEVQAIIIRQRTDHPRLGKDKLQPILSAQGFQFSESTVGRIISDLREQKKLPDPKKFSFDARTGKFREKQRRIKKKLRRPKHQPCVQTDTVVRFVDGMKRYILTAIHTENKFAFAG